MTVTARGSPGGTGSGHSILSLPLSPRTASVPVGNLADLIQAQPGLAYAGQGGLLQTVSIRGISGQRVANFYGDLPILSERRAGTSSSFIDPLMLETVEILRGPSSVYYGSGAVAGVLQLQPARPQGTEAQIQWGTGGDENLQYLGYGNQAVAVAVTRRSANDGKAADGTPLHTRFDQLNAQFLWDFKLAGRDIAFNTLVSDGEDIGKSNSRYPDQRVTDYPAERHWLAQLGGELSDSLSGSAYYHQQMLETRVDNPGQRVDEVENSARDWGLRLGYKGLAGDVPLRAGLEYFARRKVQAEETQIPHGEAPLPTWSTLDADQDSVDLYLDGTQHFTHLELAGGLRWSFLSQQALGFSRELDQAPSLFLRGTWYAASSLELSVELASGVRFPNLSERYYSGTTGRGQVIGNADLDREQTLSADLGLRWRSQRSAVELHIYSMKIDDYIERLDLAPDLRTFANLREGDILGSEAAWKFKLARMLTLHAGAHYIEGEDQSGTTLADIAPPRLTTGLEFLNGGWSASLDYEHRFKQSDVAPSEQAVDRASLLSASLGKTWAPGWRIKLWGRNLLDETYRLSSDDIAPLGAQRSFGISLSWRDPDTRNTL